MKRYLCSFLVDEEGQGLSEYGMIIALVCLTLIVALIALGDKLQVLWGNNATNLPVEPAP